MASLSPLLSLLSLAALLFLSQTQPSSPLPQPDAPELSMSETEPLTTTAMFIDEIISELEE